MTTRPLSPDETLRLTETLTASGQHRTKLFILLGASTGFRVSELLTLTFGQLLGPDGQIAREVTIARRLLKGGRGGRAKSIRSRRVPLGDRAREAIADYFATLPSLPTSDAFVFASRKGINRPITRCHAHYALKTAAREAGLNPDRIGCHSLRRQFAAGVYAGSGFDLLKVQRLLGHTSVVTTSRYLESSQTELDEVVLGFDPLALRTQTTTSTNPGPARLLAL